MRWGGSNKSLLIEFKIKNPPDSLTPLLLGYLPEGCNNQILLESARVVRTIVQVSRLSY